VRGRSKDQSKSVSLSYVCVCTVSFYIVLICVISFIFGLFFTRRHWLRKLLYQPLINEHNDVNVFVVYAIP